MANYNLAMLYGSQAFCYYDCACTGEEALTKWSICATIPRYTTAGGVQHDVLCTKECMPLRTSASRCYNSYSSDGQSAAPKLYAALRGSACSSRHSGKVPILCPLALVPAPQSWLETEWCIMPESWRNHDKHLWPLSQWHSTKDQFTLWHY